ncbi:MAG: hypothetical protein PHC41_11355 [Lachnospiraceae bacterium]|nr:hypothetical protein [Lachnospiraceae bacterium]MDD3616804.1 hypothetical protein [Lachnospiraceae bacterium]
MDDLSKQLHREMQLLQASIRELSSGMEELSGIWKDEKYKKLSESVREVAQESRQVLQAGEKAAEKIRDFQSIG